MTTVPSSWLDEDDQVNVLSTNSSQTPLAWYINGYNDVYFTNDWDYFSVGLPNGAADVIVASNWMISAAETVSTPEPGTILGLLVVGSIGVLTRKRQG